MYPMMVDVSNRLIVIVGGGNVAARKARGLLDAGAKRVRVVAPQFSVDLPAGLELLNEAYRAEHLEGTGLVFAATDQAEVNAQVVRDAHERNLLVCRADTDEEDPGDFATPAKLVSGPVVVTVSAGSPALSALIRNNLVELWDDRWSRMAEVMQALRPEILSCRTLDARQRAAVFRELATVAALDVLERSGVEGVKRWLVERHPNLSYTR